MDEKETRPWEPYIPTYVDMYYVDYRDDLSDNTKLLQDCIDKNSLYPISEYVDDRIPTTKQLRKWAMAEKGNNTQTEQK